MIIKKIEKISIRFTLEVMYVSYTSLEGCGSLKFDVVQMRSNGSLIVII